jgi:hypothetical protein
MSAEHGSVSEALRQRGGELASMPVVAGFDGFVDEMMQVVDQRQSLEAYEPVPTITRFAKLIDAAAGRSSLREVVVTGTFCGGCAVNLGDGLIAMGLPVHYFGTLGNPRHPVFDAFADGCASCTSWGREPGRTMALQFSDGKYMLSSVSQLAEFDCDLLTRVLEDGRFLAACREAKLIAITDWTLYPHMTQCWRKLQDEVFSQMRHRPAFFFDLVDPRSRSDESIREMLQVLSGFESYGSTTLGMNLNEANAVAGLLGIDVVEEEPQTVTNQAAAIREKLGISEVVTHCLKVAAAAGPDGAAAAEGPFCANPVRTVGAGDRFNAGFAAGGLLRMNRSERLILGNASSGYFVRNGRSAAITELPDFIDAWASGSL